MTVRIGSWNLRNFTAKRKGIDEIAAIIERNFDLITLLEVRKVAAVEKLIKFLPEFTFSCSEPVCSTESSAHQSGKRKERYAFVWRKSKVQLLNRPELLHGEKLFVRPPFCAFFKSGNFDFVLLAIHIVWGTLSDRKSEDSQIEKVLQQIFSHSFGEKDVILCGDFNMNSDKILELLCKTKSDAGWTPLTIAQTMVKGSNSYDQIWINRVETKEFDGLSGVIAFDEKFGSAEAAIREMSDHRPVFAEFSTLLDDDQETQTLSFNNVTF